VKKDTKTRDQIFKAAMRLSMRTGYNKVTRDAIATKAGVAEGLVNYYFGTMTQLRRMIVRHAIKEENMTIIAQALGAADPHVKKISEELKRKAVESLMG
jgi:AcrR family transcriptional regulator